jgi:hypothetical protein
MLTHTGLKHTLKPVELSLTFFINKIIRHIHKEP